MVLAAIAVGVAAGFYANSLPKTYSSSVDFYARNISITSDVITQSNLASEQLINDYIKIIKSEAVLTQIADELENTHGIKMTPAAIGGLISAGTSSETSTFTIKVSHNKPETALKIAKSIETVAPLAVTQIVKSENHIKETLAPGIAETIVIMSERGVYGISYEKLEELSELKPGTSDYNKLRNNIIDELAKDITLFLQTDSNLALGQMCFVTINHPVLDSVADSPDVSKYVTIGAVAALIIVYVIFFIRGLFNMNVTTEEDIKKLINHPLIGTIPSWETSSKKYDKRYYKNSYDKQYANKYNTVNK